MPSIRRRDFISLVGGAATWPLAARAQQAATPLVGFLGVGPPSSNLPAFLRGLNEMGFAQGRNLTIEFRESEQYDRLPSLAAELVQRRVAVIFTDSNTNAAQAAKAATTTIPIVFTVGVDPVATGLVASLARPGGNLTGVTYLALEMGAKRLELLRELLPNEATIALLVNPTGSTPGIETVETAARRVGQKLVVLRASTASEIDAAFATLAEERVGGLLVAADSFFVARRAQLVALAARHRIPSVYSTRVYTDAGGLMSYSDDRRASWHQAGLYVGRILKGEKPADLPIVQAATFEFVINLETAKELGLSIPLSHRARATEVIE